MSILVADNTTPTLPVSNLFSSAQGYPFTAALYVKVSGWATAAYYSTQLLRFGSATENYYAGIIRNSPGAKLVYAGAEVGGVEDSLSIDLATEIVDTWKPLVIVYESATSRTLYTILNDGTVDSRVETASLSPAGVVNCTFFPEAIEDGPIRIAHVAAYQAALTSAQAEEYMTSGTVAAVTPYAKWDATSDWGAGTITDSGSSGTNITPPAGWTYSADNPDFTAAAAALTATLVADANDTALPSATNVNVRVFSTTNILIGTGTIGVGTDGAVSITDSSLTLASGQSITAATEYRVDFQEAAGTRQRTVNLTAA